MLSDADYQELKAQQRNLNAEGRTALREYELSNPQHVATGALGSSGITKLRETEPETPKVNVPELPPDKPVAAAQDKLAALSEQVNVPLDETDPTRDLYLTNASKLKSLDVPPEYVAKNPFNGIKHVATATLGDPLNGPGVGVYHEPSEKQFQADMAPLLSARGIAPGSEEYAQAFAEYKDRKWAQAYQEAQANDTPLTRSEYVPRSSAWEKLKGALAEAPDVASAFAKGFASGGTLHATEALETDADREQAERDPIARGAGELVGSMRTTGPLAKITKGAGDVASRLVPSGFLGRLASGAIAGGVGGAADVAGRGVAETVRGEPNAKERFVQSLPGALEMGAGFGAVGQLIAEGANLFQKKAIADMPEIGQLRRGGGDTSILGGVTPGKDVAANIEAAREPIPGEAKAPPGGNATEIAAKKVQQPLTEANAAAHTSAHQTIAAQQDAAIAADPKLQEQLPASKTAQAAVDWALAKLQPEARPGYLPGISKPLSADVLPGADISEVQKIAPRLWKPRLVLATDAGSVANRARGRAITLDEARQMGLDVGGLSKGLGTEGVPLDAPPIPDAGMGSPDFDAAAAKANSVAAETGAHDALNTFLNEQRRPVSRAEYERYDNPTSDAVNEFLRTAQEKGATYDGPVVRGTTKKELEALLSEGKTRRVWSVSKDREGALSFARKHGVLLELEGDSGAVPVDGIAGSNTFGEALIPRDTHLEVVSSTEANGVTTVKLRRVSGPDEPAGATTEDIFGRPADKISPSGTDRLKPREGRAKPPEPGPVGSDWFDEAKAAETVALHSGDYEVKDPFAHTPAPQAGGNFDTPTMPGTPEAPPPTPSVRPSGAPSALRAAPQPPPLPGASGVLPPPHAPSGPAIGGIPESEYRVILEPRRFDAKTFEEILGDVDRKAKAGSATATPDPAWKQLQRAIREDREQFGPEWSKLIAKHHELLNEVEQRSYHAGMTQAKPYSEMAGSSQQTLNGKLVDFPGGTDAAKALRELAAQAPPEVQHDLEVLGAQNAYSKLSGMANPKIGETLGSGGVTGHLRGLGPATKLRADALARAVSAGPTGEPTITPRLADFVKRNAPKPRYLPGAMGGGALGMKAATVYNSTRDRGSRAPHLTPDEQQFLEKLIEAHQEAP